MLPKLYYIASNHPKKSHLDQVQEACEAGIKLIQLRIKGFDPEEVLPLALQCRSICSKYGVKLIINDFIEIAHQAEADGVHLGQQDGNILEARALLGNKFIIGGTANTMKQIKKLVNEGVDYIGLGPFRFTTTKKVLSPVIGLNGYQKIMQDLQSENNHIPVYAIGGITSEDISPLLQTGVHGVCISGFLVNSGQFKYDVETINSLLEWNI